MKNNVPTIYEKNEIKYSMNSNHKLTITDYSKNSNIKLVCFLLITESRSKKRRNI